MGGAKLAWFLLGTGFIGLPVFGIEFLIIEALIYLLFALFNLGTGFYKGWLSQKVASEIFIKGITRKFGYLLFTLILIAGVGLIKLLCGDMIFYGVSLINFIGIIPHVYLVLLMFTEFISITENMVEISSDNRESRIFKIFNAISLKLFNKSLDSLDKRANKEIDKIFDNMEKNLDNN